jgi:hypothetical protein
VLNSRFVGNRGGSGGAIYNDGDDRTGTPAIRRSTLLDTPDNGFTAGLPRIFFLGAHRPSVTNSILR